MAPGEVRARQHDEIGGLKVFVGPGHRVRAEGAAMPGDRGRHAQARIGVDVGRADKALHQLVGDVIVFGEDLPGDVKRHAIRAMLRNRLREPPRDEIQRVIPVCAVRRKRQR